MQIDRSLANNAYGKSGADQFAATSRPLPDVAYKNFH